MKLSSTTVAAALFASALLLSSPAFACKCMLPPVEAAREDASALFEGRVISIDDIAGASVATNGEKKVTLAIVRTWKGLDNVEQVAVYTNGSSAACGYSFAKDVSYLIYARDHEGRITVSSCSRTKPIGDSAEDLAILGAGSTPVKVEPKPVTDTTKSAPTGALETAPATTPDGAGTPSAAPPPPAKHGCGAGTHAMLPWLLLGPALGKLRRRKLSP
jgi:hypothetical protein